MRGQGNGDSALLQPYDGGSFHRLSPDGLVANYGGYWLQFGTPDGGSGLADGSCDVGDDEGDGPA